MGYTPDPFVNMSVDLRDYNCRVYLRNVSASLEDYFEKYQDDLPEDMVFKLYRKHQKSLKESGIIDKKLYSELNNKSKNILLSIRKLEL